MERERHHTESQREQRGITLRHKETGMRQAEEGDIFLGHKGRKERSHSYIGGRTLNLLGIVARSGDWLGERHCKSCGRRVRLG